MVIFYVALFLFLVTIFPHWVGLLINCPQLNDKLLVPTVTKIYFCNKRLIYANFFSFQLAQMVILRERRKAARLVVPLVVPPHQVWSPTSTTNSIVMIKAMEIRVCGNDYNSGEGFDEHTASLLMTIMRTRRLEAKIYTSTS